MLTKINVAPIIKKFIRKNTFETFKLDHFLHKKGNNKKPKGNFAMKQLLSFQK